MSWTQVKNFDPKKMGSRKGYCLYNVRVGFGITKGKYASAKEDMLAQKKAGTLHAYSTLPKTVAVPVYTDTTSPNEHIIVSDKGVFYSNGKKVSAPKASTVFGWGEFCTGVRVVKEVAGESFFPKKGYWKFGDTDKRIGELAEFMYKKFPAYTDKKALGNYFGSYLKAAITEFQRRTGLDPDGAVGPKTYAMLKKYGFTE